LHQNKKKETKRVKEEGDDQVNKGKKEKPEKVRKKDENRMITGTKM
jgi:hypothetical protein